MKYIYRCLIITICLIFWAGIWYAVTQIGWHAEKMSHQDAFSFPCLLQETDLYLWTLNSGEGGTGLLMQNIGKIAISDIEIVFLSFGRYYVFKAEKILPGKKLWVYEQSGEVLPIGQDVICTFVCVN